MNPEGNILCYLVGGFNPFEKYARQNGNLSQVGMKIKNIWNHHLRSYTIVCYRILILCRHTCLHVFVHTCPKPMEKDVEAFSRCFPNHPNCCQKDFLRVYLRTGEPTNRPQTK